MKVIPDGVNYFYGYPGAAAIDPNESKKFYNNVPFETVERKVASRVGIMGCDYMNFSSNTDKITTRIYELFGFNLDRQNVFDPDIEIFSTLLEKDKKIKSLLISTFDDESIYQAQPYSESEVLKKYVGPSKSAVNLNDKLFMSEWIPSKYLGQRSTEPFNEFPFMAKLSRSSAGDATFKINNEQELETFLQNFGEMAKDIPVFYEKLAQGKEYGIELFRTYDGKTGIIKVIDSMVDENNSYMGGLIKGRQTIDENIKQLMDHVFKYLESINWYGRGGLDVIVGEDGKITAIDPNMRITQIMGAARDSYTNSFQNDMLYKSFRLNLEDKHWFDSLKNAINAGILRGYSATLYGGKLHGDAGILFDTQESLDENIQDLQKMGFII